MSFPSSFESAEKYLDECTAFFKEFRYVFCHQNNEVLVKNVLDHINVCNFESVDVFDKNFDITRLIQDDDYLKRFFFTWDRLQVHFDDVEEKDFDNDIEAPVSPKKRYEVLNLVNEVVNICENYNCDLLVDFGSGLGYIDQLIYDVADYKVLGLESNDSHYDSAQKRQKEYHTDSTSNVKFLKHTVKEDSHLKIAEYLQEVFPDHGQFCVIGLHACADLTVEAMCNFLKMPDAKSLAVLPCCYHKMTKDGANFKYFPLSGNLKKIFEKHDAYSFTDVSFLRLAAHAGSEQRDLYEKVFSLLVRSILELYAHNNGLIIKRNKRKAVRMKGKKDFETYIQDAVNTGYSLIPKPNPADIQQETCKNDEIVNGFNMDELRRLWWKISQGPLFKKAGIYILMQEYMQPIVENFILLDRLLFLKENGIEKCWYKKIFNQIVSPRCLALIAVK
ncbi:unnamed protein product [Diatraea saccharalis]|uniref:Methyltransferase domain-containing protein n=1 Tax=Diatraea saccharalis TaxID=40085 RepID=A0A9N9RD56_9NEOP|nr:unnamed protein product [Diatraea saccharalis]